MICPDKGNQDGDVASLRHKQDLLRDSSSSESGQGSLDSSNRAVMKVRDTKSNWSDFA